MRGKPGPKKDGCEDYEKDKCDWNGNTPLLKKSKKIESPAEKCTAMLYGFLLNENSVKEDSGNFNFVVVAGKRIGIGD